MYHSGPAAPGGPKPEDFLSSVPSSPQHIISKPESVHHASISAHPPARQLACSACTFHNTISALSCEMCGGDLKPLQPVASVGTPIHANFLAAAAVGPPILPPPRSNATVVSSPVAPFSSNAAAVSASPTFQAHAKVEAPPKYAEVVSAPPYSEYSSSVPSHSFTGVLYLFVLFPI